MTTANGDQQLLPKQFHDDDEIDLGQVAGALLRRWTWLASGSAIGLILSGLHLINTKQVYQGEFQIVINQEGSNNGAAALLSQNSGLAALAGLGGVGNMTPSPPKFRFSKAPQS